VYVPRIGREPAPVGADYEALVASAAVWVAIEANSIVGVLVLQPQSDALLLENVAVAPVAQHRGIGRALIAFAEDRARERGVGAITLYTGAQMTENQALSRKLGYVEINQCSEHGFDRVYFEKRLES
jgi:GNAT superfamily N-acetyltransferase